MIKATRFLYAAFALCGLLLSACNSKQKPEEDHTVLVKTMKVIADNHVVGKSYMGVIEEEDGANVSFSVPGTVTRVMVEEGQFVKKGQVLAELDGERLKNSHDISMASLKHTEDSYRRLKALYDQGTLPEVRMVEIETLLSQARSAEAISRKNLDDIVLYAPFEGYVASTAVHEGAGVLPGVAGFKLVKIDRVKVSFSIPEHEIGKIKKGQQVDFTVSALNDSSFTATVVNRGVTASIINHTYQVKARCDNRSHALLPGMVCKVRMPDSKGDYVIVVPQQAVQISGQERFVWIVRQGKAHRQPVVTGDIISAGVVIESGLTAGDIIITVGQNKVCEGTEVKSEAL